MSPRLPFFALCFALIALPAIALPRSIGFAADAKPITVFAAASLREALTDIGTEFKKASGIGVAFNFAGSDALATQIIQGAPADVFASANLTQMQRVRDAGRLAGGATVFARNRLTIIVPAGNPAKIRGPGKLADPGVKVVLAAASVPVGAYARETLTAMSTNGSFGADFAGRVEKNVVSNELDVKAVATKVALGEADAGIVYETDVTTDIAPRVHAIAIPAEFMKPIVYPAAALKGDNSEAGAKFVQFLATPAAQAVLRKAGFLPPPQA